MAEACHVPWQSIQNHPSGHSGGFATAWLEEEMLNGQCQRVDIPAHTRTAYLWPPVEIRRGSLLNHPDVPPTPELVKELNQTELSFWTEPDNCHFELNQTIPWTPHVPSCTLCVVCRHQRVGHRTGPPCSLGSGCRQTDPSEWVSAVAVSFCAYQPSAFMTTFYICGLTDAVLWLCHPLKSDTSLSLLGGGESLYITYARLLCCYFRF